MTIEILTQRMYASMKNGDKLRKEVFSSVIGAVKKVAIDKGCRDNIPESLVDEVILKEQKTLREMIDTCPVDRVETLTEYKNKLAVIEEIAPKMLTEDEIVMELGIFCTMEGIDPVVANRAKIMKGFMPTIKGRADGKLANQVISNFLA